MTEVRTGALLRFTTDPNTRELTLGPLHPFYTYHCTIVAHTVEPGPFTEVITIQTDEAGKKKSTAAIQLWYFLSLQTRFNEYNVPFKIIVI